MDRLPFVWPSPVRSGVLRPRRTRMPHIDAAHTTSPEGPTIEAVEGFTPAELRKLRSLKDPNGIQKFLDAMPYHLATSAWSPRRVLHMETAHCLEGAIFAAAALRAIGRPPLIIDFEAERDTDH